MRGAPAPEEGGDEGLDMGGDEGGEGLDMGADQPDQAGLDMGGDDQGGGGGGLDLGDLDKP